MMISVQAAEGDAEDEGADVYMGMDVDTGV